MNDGVKTVKYRFNDTDETGRDEYDIEGDDYRRLIDVCCQYCSVVSFEVSLQHEDAEYLKQIQKYMIKRDNTYREVTGEFGSCIISGADKRYYTVCPEICGLLKKENNIFSWYYQENKYFHFENLTFYRKDGSVFFESVTHDGKCDLIPIEGEDISRVVSNGLWEKNPKPMQYDFTPKTKEWMLEYEKECERIKTEKYNRDLKQLKEKPENTEHRNKFSLQNCHGITKIADKFGFSVDKVIDDFLAL